MPRIEEEMMEARKVCSGCNGTGHDKNSNPVLILQQYRDKEGNKVRRHITKSQGSGCHVCHGKVVREEE